jgi:hypothetical protein
MAEMTKAPVAGAADPAEVLVPDVSRLAARLRSFVVANGGTGTAVVNYLGRRGARIVVVSGDGPFTDAVVGGVPEANAACEAAGISVQDWDRELSARVTVSASDRHQMRGTGR